MQPWIEIPKINKAIKSTASGSVTKKSIAFVFLPLHVNSHQINSVWERVFRTSKEKIRVGVFWYCLSFQQYSSFSSSFFVFFSPTVPCSHFLPSYLPTYLSNYLQTSLIQQQEGRGKIIILVEERERDYVHEELLRQFL